MCSSSASFTVGYQPADEVGEPVGRLWPGEVDVLEQPVHGVADLRRMQPSVLRPLPASTQDVGRIPATRSA